MRTVNPSHRPAPKPEPKIVVTRHTMWSALGAATPGDPPLLDLKSGEATPAKAFRGAVAAVGLLFLSQADAKCRDATTRSTIEALLAQVALLEVPTRIVVVACDEAKADFDRSVERLPAGLLVPFGDPRIHILRSFRDAPTTPALVMFDSAGNKINPNAFEEMSGDLEKLEHFPWRSAGSLSLIKLFRADYVDSAITDRPCVMLVRLFKPAAETEPARELFEKNARAYREARGTSTLTFLRTRTLEEVPTARDKDKCRNGHVLGERGAFDPATCNGCNSRVERGARCCVPCGFDLCDACFASAKQLPHPDWLLLALLADEFRRATPQRTCVIGWNYATGVFLGCDRIDDGEEMLGVFQRLEAPVR